MGSVACKDRDDSLVIHLEWHVASSHMMQPALGIQDSLGMCQLCTWTVLVTVSHAIAGCAHHTFLVHHRGYAVAVCLCSSVRATYVRGKLSFDSSAVHAPTLNLQGVCDRLSSWC